MAQRSKRKINLQPSTIKKTQKIHIRAFSDNITNTCETTTTSTTTTTSSTSTTSSTPPPTTSYKRKKRKTSSSKKNKENTEINISINAEEKNEKKEVIFNIFQQCFCCNIFNIYMFWCWYMLGIEPRSTSSKIITFPT
jgi:hypothetical protein